MAWSPVGEIHGSMMPRYLPVRLAGQLDTWENSKYFTPISCLKMLEIYGNGILVFLLLSWI